MKKKLLSIVLCMMICGMAFSQESTDKKSAFQLSFVPPLSTNGMNAAQYTNAVSLNILVGVSQNETVLTIGSLANIIGNNSEGLQFAGLCNYVGNEGSGMLFSGLANVTRNNYNGLQFAGLANVAEDVNGFQLAGLINIAKNVSGVQFAGLVNVAESSDYPIGLLNLIKDGEMGVAVTYNEIGSTAVTFRSGGKVTYGIFGVGYNHKVSDNSFFTNESDGLWKVVNLSSFVTTAGIGAHINVSSWLRINNELSGETIGNFLEETTFKAGYMLLPAFRIGQHFELFGGASINYMQTDNLSNIGMFPSNSLWKDFGSSKLQQVYIGYQFGFQYIF